MKLIQHLLVTALLISLGLMASCAEKAEPQNMEESDGEKPTLMWSTTRHKK